MLKVQDIYKSFAGNHVLTGCEFELEEGKITALIGPNGAGKTTLFDIITGFLSLDMGRVYFGDEEITNERSHKLGKAGIARTFQKVRLFEHLSILDHLLMAQLRDDDALLKHFRPRKDHPNMIKKAKDIMTSFKVDKDPDTLVSDLSYGQRKLLTLAMAILMPHKLLMLDEPVAGVNQKTRDVIIDKIREQNKKGGTVLIIEHDMHFVGRIADHVFVLDDGKVIASGTPAEVKKNKKVLEAYLGD